MAAPYPSHISLGQPISHHVDHILSGSRAAIAVKVFGLGRRPSPGFVEIPRNGSTMPSGSLLAMLGRHSQRSRGNSATPSKAGTANGEVGV